MSQYSPTPVPTTPTQTKYPWRAVARTVFAGIIGGLTLLPEIAADAHIGTVPTVAQVLAVTGAITRILALPSVDAWLTTYLPWLGAAPSRPSAP
ncbi:hypothetical protein GCM10023322_73020 [Rugosimonospora acidiphila]|uniref:Holin n=2 Tax=Rugosimonospora acidiphila TaxID=556531 RepID=A0ABP9SPD5_9ACTN